MTAIFKVLFYLAIAIVVVVVAYWNGDQRVDVTYYPGQVLQGVPVFLVILGSIFIGVLLAGLIGAGEYLRYRLRQRQLRLQIEALEAEVRELRNLPISEGLMDQDEDLSSWRQQE